MDFSKYVLENKDDLAALANAIKQKTGKSNNLTVSQMKAEVEGIEVGVRYEGEYDITPKVEAQTLPTAEKVLERDIKINGIPYAEVSNTFGGKTVSIA